MQATEVRCTQYLKIGRIYHFAIMLLLLYLLNFSKPYFLIKCHRNSSCLGRIAFTNSLHIQDLFKTR